MALPYKSIATIDAPEFINLTPLDINPLMSKCEIKVFYLGHNRNGSHIEKDVASEMAKTLRGAPIVGYYKQDKEDFRDHGHEMIWDGDGIKCNCKTVPYGFVAPDAEVWFQKFIDEDAFGNEIEREYLMTTGYLWTGQYAEAQQVFEDGGKPQSMELDENTLQGNWAEDVQSGMEFFIISDAIFTKLCILGDDVEPCFEGSSVTTPDVSSNFTLATNDEFIKSLSNMMKDLQYALKGDTQVDGQNVITPENEQAAAPEAVETPVVENTVAVETPVETPAPEENTPEVPVENTVETQENTEAQPEVAPVEEFKKDEEEDKSENEGEEKKEEEEDKKKKYELLESELATLKADFEALKVEAEALLEFKAEVDNKQKDELIGQFYMLSDEDKKDVVENKASYSLDDIKAKLSVICFEKKVNFVSTETIENQENTETVATTFAVDNNDVNIPDWIKAVKEVEKSQN